MTPYRADKSCKTSYLDPGLGLLVHSHLRWDFVWQRPQQILSRIAEHNPVLFVEEPCFVDDRRSGALNFTLAWGVLRVVPQLPRSLEGDYDKAIATVRGLLQRALRQQPLTRHFHRLIQWFYTPMPAPAMLDAFGEEGVVYDCMDELSQFRFAPRDLGQREKLLLSRADIVFTGGYQLYQLKSRFHSNVHFFGCGVDVDHFGRARRDDTVVPRDVASLPRPVLGYFGVIDERLDYELIANLAAQFPEGTVLMIGPTAKVDLASLPTAPNVKWLGQRPYSDLPAYVKTFDVCLMPFALNEATEYINPTKTLEYMAAGKPIVSTPVADVQRNFGSVVAVAHSADEFVERVRDVLKDPQAQRIQAGIAVAEAQSWEGVVGRMSALTATALARRSIPLTTAAAVLSPSERPPRLRIDAVKYADPVAEAS